MGLLGGIITGAEDLFGPSPYSSTPPNPRAVGNQYLQLVQAFMRGEPNVYGVQAQYQPQFEQLDLNSFDQALPTMINAGTTANTATRTANVNDFATLAPRYISALKSANPDQTALTDQLTKTATDQLALGTTLDPASTNRITSGVRSNWAGRGLGDSLPAGLSEAMQLYGGGENLLNQRESTAEGVAGMNESMYENPLLTAFTATSNAPAAAGAIAGKAGESLFPASQNYDMFNTAYNANAASSIANANNQAAVQGANLSY